jgi:hypothetical protein
LGLAVRSFAESSSHKSLSEIQIDVDVDVKKHAWKILQVLEEMVPAIWAYVWLRTLSLERRDTRKTIDTKWYVAFAASETYGSTNMAAVKKGIVSNHSSRRKKRQAVVCFKHDSCVVVIVVE